MKGFRSRIHPIVVVLVMILAHGCAGIYNVVEFEVLEPATVNLPENVRNLLILNRAPVSVHSFQEEDISGLEAKQLIMLDTLIMNNVRKGLLSVLRESPTERFRYPKWLDERGFDTSSLYELELTRREVEDICMENGADAILSLESYSMDYVEHIIPYPGSYVTRTAYYEISSIIKWNIYLPGYPRAFDTYTMYDTLFFSEVQNGKLIRKYNAAEILTESFNVSGRKYGRYLVPVWNRTTRTLYKGREVELKVAAKYTDEGDWESAYDIWEALSESSDSTAAAKALYNMAVYHELEDDLQLAYDHIEKALSLDSLDMIISYEDEMETRILNKRELYMQVR